MSGIAFIIKGADFSANNLGQVTFLEDADVTGITIVGDEIITGTLVQYTASYAPANTSQRECTWSIVSGGQYAAMDTNTGKLSIKTGANAAKVVIKATSTFDSTVTATKELTVTYQEFTNELTGCEITGSAVVVGEKAQYSVTYAPVNSSLTGGTWSIVSGGQYATINQSGQLTILGIANASTVAIQFVTANNATSGSSSGSKLTVTKQVTVTYKEAAIDLSGKVAYVPLPLCTANFTVYLKTKTFITDGGSYTRYNVLADTPFGFAKGNGAFTLNCWYQENNRKFGSAVYPSGAYNGSIETGHNTFMVTSGPAGGIKECLANNSQVVVDGTKVDTTLYNATKGTSRPYLYINIGGAVQTIDIGGMTKADIESGKSGGTILPNLGNLVFENLIVFHNTKYTTVEEVLANRARADIDLVLGEDGTIKNAGSSGAIVYA